MHRLAVSFQNPTVACFGRIYMLKLGHSGLRFRKTYRTYIIFGFTQTKSNNTTLTQIYTNRKMYNL